MAASARSSHSATRRRGSRPSAIDSSPPAGTSGLPSAFSRTFCSLTAWRTAGRPPCRARSATGRCSSGRSASTALRWARPGLRRFGFGRCGSSGGAVKLGRLRRSRRGPRSGRCCRRDGRRRAIAGGTIGAGRCTVAARWPVVVAARPAVAAATVAAWRSPVAARSRLASCWVTPSNGLSLGIRSSRPDFSAFSLVVRHRQDRHAVELDFGVGLEHRTDLGTGGQQRTIEYTFWLACSGSAPGPRAVLARAGELDFDPSGHRSATVSGESGFAPPLSAVVGANALLTTVSDRAHLRPR